MARWLGIDGALGAFSAAAVSDDGSPETVASASGKDALERGLRIIDDVLAGARLADLSGIAIGTGPGSFTGLRIALGFAKSLAFAAGVPLASVSSYDALEPLDATAPWITFVHGRSGIACARFRPVTGEPVVVCGTYAHVADRLTTAIGAAPATVSPGAPAGALSALGERGLTVRESASSSVVPALAIARRALAGFAHVGSAHAPVADYGEAAYYERPGAAPGT